MQTTFVLASLAGSALAGINMGHPLLKRDVNALQPRQTGSSSDIPNISGECQTAIVEVLNSIPTPPAEIASEERANPQTGDPCSFTTPESLKDEYSSYSSEVLSWYSDNSASVESAFSVCSELTDVATDFVDFCSTESGIPTLIGGEATKTGSSDSEETTDSSSDSSDNTESSSETADSADNTETSTGAAPRETGMAFAAIAVGLVAAAL